MVYRVVRWLGQWDTRPWTSHGLTDGGQTLAGILDEQSRGPRHSDLRSQPPLWGAGRQEVCTELQEDPHVAGRVFSDSRPNCAVLRTEIRVIIIHLPNSTLFIVISLSLILILLWFDFSSEYHVYLMEIISSSCSLYIATHIGSFGYVLYNFVTVILATSITHNEVYFLCFWWMNVGIQWLQNNYMYKVEWMDSTVSLCICYLFVWTVHVLNMW